MKQGRVPFRKFCREVSIRSGIKREISDKVIKATISTIKDIMFKQGDVVIPHFCVFSTQVVLPEIRRLPKGSMIFKETRIRPKFNYAESFRHQIGSIKISTSDKDIPLIEGE